MVLVFEKVGRRNKLLYSVEIKLNGDSVQDFFFFVTIAFSDSKDSSAHKKSKHNHTLNHDASDLCPSPKTIYKNNSIKLNQ
jgi:hypothetical protein